MSGGRQEHELPLDGALLKARILARFAGVPQSYPRLGRFEIVRRLGAGGQGEVYEARDLQGGAAVALKVLARVDADRSEPLQREFRALAGLVHPNLIVLHELFCLEQRCFFTMELLYGTDFVRFARGPLRTSNVDAARLRPALVQLLRGVAAMHAAGKIHRDLKPSNVLVEPDGRVVIIDYGLTLALSAARRSPVGTPCSGTAGYLAPECAAGEAASPASDMYAVGAILLRALSGAEPDQVRDPRALALADGDLSALCRELLARDPRERPSAARALALLEDAPERIPAARVRVDDAGDEPFFGRAAQLAALCAALAGARAGDPHVVLVHGASGMGKSALLQRFRTQHCEGCLVLSGRCYERESTPYKVLDGLLGDLSEAIERLPAPTRQRLLSPQATASLCILPELSRLRTLLAGGPEPPRASDPTSLRDQAFTALRELLRGLSAEHPLVLIVDDLQWGDRDSALLIASLFAAAGPFPLLLVGSYRSDEAATSPFLEHALGADGLATRSCQVSELALEPLSEAEAEATASELVRRAGSPAGLTLSACARAAQGLPFLLRELVEHALLRTEDAPPARDAQALIALRARTCTAAAQRLLEVLCVAGRPLSHALASCALDALGTAHPAAAELCVLRLARTRDTTLERCLEPYHDIVRAAVVQRLTPGHIRSIHQRLAQAMRRLRVDEPEHLLGHLLAAGEADAGEVALEAAERAARRLAWGRAAELFGIALRLRGADAPPAFHARQAEMLSFSARHAESATAYLQAAERSPPEARSALQRLAASQYLRAGMGAEGIALFRTLLRNVGLRYPDGDVTAVLAYVSGRLRESARIPRLPPARPRSPRSRERLAALDAVYRELWLYDPMRGAVVHLWFYREARRAADASYVRALLAEIVHQALLHGYAAERTIARLEQQLERLTAVGATPYEQALVLLARAFALIHCRLKPGAALPLLERADALLARDCPGTQFEHAWLQLAREYVWHAVGDFRALVAAAGPRAHTHPQDGYGLCQQLLSVPQMLLIEDRPGAALRFVEERWRRSKGPLRTSDYAAICSRSEALIYAGDALSAEALLRRELRWVGILPGTRARVLALDGAYQSARNAAAVYWSTRDVARARRIAKRAAEVRALPAVVRGHFRLLEASVARAERRDGDARALYRRAIDELSSGQAEQAVACARYRLAQVDGSRERLAEADAWLRERGLRNPARWVTLCAPGPEDFR